MGNPMKRLEDDTRTANAAYEEGLKAATSIADRYAETGVNEDARGAAENIAADIRALIHR